MDASNTYDWSVIKPKFDSTVKPLGFLPSLSGLKNYGMGVLKRFGGQLHPDSPLPNAALKNPDAEQSDDFRVRLGTSLANEALYPYRSNSAAATRASVVGESAQNGINGIPPMLARPAEPSGGSVAAMLRQFNRGSDYMRSPTNQPKVVSPQIPNQNGAPGYVDYSGFHSVNEAPTFSGRGGSFTAPAGSIDAREAERFSRFGPPDQSNWMKQRMLNSPI